MTNAPGSASGKRCPTARSILPQPETYQTLRDDLNALDGGNCNRLYYLSIAPEFYADVVCNLGALDMARENGGWRRIVIEKPFGYDLGTAQSLNRDRAFRVQGVAGLPH